MSKRYEKIAFVASASSNEQAALQQLAKLYGNHDADNADAVVALGGDGLMLQTLHQVMDRQVPVLRHELRLGRLPDERFRRGRPAYAARRRPSRPASARCRWT